MPKVPLHQLDIRIEAATLDVESARGVHPTLTGRIQLMEGELIDARGVGFAQVGDRIDALEALVGTSPRGNLLQTQTIHPVAGQTVVPLPVSFDPAASDLLVYRNGQLQHVNDDFTMSASAITFATSLFASEYVDFLWFTLPTNSRYVRIDVSTPGTVFTIPDDITIGAQVLVTVDNLLQTPSVNYTISGSALTFANTIGSSSIIELRSLVFDGRSSGWTVQITASGGEQLIQTPYAYIPGSHQLLVFLDGRLLTPGTVYTEQDAYRLYFSTPLTAGQHLYVVGSARNMDRLGSLEEKLRLNYVAELRRELRLRIMEERSTYPTMRVIRKGTDGFNLTGFSIIEDFVVNLMGDTNPAIVVVPADPDGTASSMMILVAGDYLADTNINTWMPLRGNTTILVPAGGILAGCAVLYR